MDAAGWLFPVLAVLTWTVLFLKGYVGAARTPVVVPRLAPEDRLPQVAIFVPARNEVRTIAPCVTALARQGAVVDRLIVIDDRSNDGTRERLVELEEQYSVLQVVSGRGPGPGEYGKPAALRDAFELARPSCEWLLFVDADVMVSPGAVAGLLDLAQERSADLVSVFPALDLETPIERLLMPSFAAIIAARYPADRVADPTSPVAFANGQLILVRRSAYEAIAGHAAVVGEVLEDVRLAEAVKDSGRVLCLADGRAIARTRMYESWSEIVEGWSKNYYLLVGGRPHLALFWAVASVAAASIGLLALLFAGWPQGGIAYGYTLAIQMILRRRGGAPPGWAIFAPAAALMVAYVILRSMRLHLAGGTIRWKGRRYRRVSRLPVRGGSSPPDEEPLEIPQPTFVASSGPPPRARRKHPGKDGED